MLLSWLSAVIFGLVAGIVAKVILPGDDPGGCIVTSILGIVGALIGQTIGTVIGLGEMNRWSFANFSLAVIGAILLLVIYRLITKKKLGG